MKTACSAFRHRPRQYPIAQEGFIFIAIFFAFALLFLIADWLTLSGLFFFLTLFSIYFFRNPERIVSDEEDLIVAPADGKVLSVTKSVNAPETGLPMTKISIFMSIMNVHINRFPVSAIVKKVIYHRGKFFVASLDKASEKNERNVIILEDDNKREFVMVQIAGLIARRIVCYQREGDKLDRGERYGMIRFGSRVDLYVPDSANVLVAKGNKTVAGETILGRL